MTSKVHSVVILGELSVGKSALCRSFFHNGLSNQDDCDCVGCDEEIRHGFGSTTLTHNVYERPVFVKDEKCKLRILDVNTEKHLLESCTDEMSANLGNFVNAGKAYIVAYAVTDRGTFTTAEEILSRLFCDFATSMCSKPVILVGNKCDLVRKRRVTTADGVRLARKFAVKFIETSATLNQNVEELFSGLMNQIHLRETEAQRPESASSGDSTRSRDKRANLVKRFSMSFLNPFVRFRKENEKLSKRDQSPDPVNDASSSSKDESFKAKKTRGKLQKIRRSKTTDLRMSNPCQDFSVL